MEARQFRERDLQAVAKLYVNTFNSPPWNDGWTIEVAQERLSRYFRTPDSLGVVAIENSEVIAFALGVMERCINGEHFHLKEMCCDAKHRRHGIGTHILKALNDMLYAHG